MENSEKYALLGQRIILQVGTGNYSYPSELAKDNIIQEQVFEDNWILPRQKKRIDFSLGKLNAGKYHLDVYSWVLKSMFIGSNAIMYNPTTEYFTVNGEAKQEIFINRSETNFGKDNTIGPLGFPVEVNEKFNGEVYITNNTTSEKNNLKLVIQLCDWSTSFCSGDLFESGQEKIEKEFNVPKIGAEETINFNVEMTAPSTPSAYEINLILKENDEVLSIYKNRIIVTGGTAKIRKIIFDGLKFKDYKLNVLFAGSPDHFTYPDFENFNLKMTVFNEGIVLDTKEENISKIETGQVKGQIFSIEESIFDKICVEINKDTVVYDKECFTIDIELLQKDYDETYPEEMKISYNYNEINEELELSLSKEILNKIDARVRVLGNDNLVFVNEFIKQAGTYANNFSLKKDNYTLIIDDFTAKKQQVIYLNLVGNNIATDTALENSCVGQICGEGTVCSTNTYKSLNGDCCKSECIPSSNSQGILGILTIPLIFWIALILIIISGVILFNVIKNKGAKK
jgi:hypothetical protein